MTIKDTDAIIGKIEKRFCEHCDRYNGVVCRACQVMDCMDEIDGAPTVDAVEVVRCKDCTHFKAEHYNDDGFYFTQWCDLYKMQKNDDDFCSERVRKDGDSDGNR